METSISLHSVLTYVMMGLVSLVIYFLKSDRSEFKKKQGELFTKLAKLESSIRSDSDILNIVNGKYQSRREVDIMLTERDQWRKSLDSRIETIEGEINRLRDQNQEATAHTIGTLNRTVDILRDVADRISRK